MAIVLHGSARTTPRIRAELEVPCGWRARPLHERGTIPNIDWVFDSSWIASLALRAILHHVTPEVGPPALRLRPRLN